MAEERRNARKPGRPAAGRSGPGYAERLKAQRKQAARDREAALAKARAEHREKARLTSRAAVLVLVLAVLAVSYASSLRAYLQQRDSIDALEQQIAGQKADIAELAKEKQRWKDPQYVQQQARERFGYVPKGATPFVVLDADGRPLDSSVELDDPASVPDPDKRQWFQEVWDSVTVAGDPPTRVQVPKAEIDPPQEDLVP